MKNTGAIRCNADHTGAEIKPQILGLASGPVNPSLDEWVLSLLYLRFAILIPSATLAEVADGAMYGV
jgi:hypothetical protein